MAIHELMDTLYDELTTGMCETNGVPIVATFVFHPSDTLRDFWPIDESELGIGD